MNHIPFAMTKPAAGPAGLTFQQLHEAFTGLIAREPWTLVDESEILAVQHPASGEVYYAYFMGELGEVVGFNLYRGEHIAPWLHTLDDMDETGLDEADMLSHSFYQLTAAKKAGLEKEIVKLHETAGITVPKGKAGYLEPLSYRSGFVPVMMDEQAMQEVVPLLPGFRHLLEELAAGRLEAAGSLYDEGQCYVAALQDDGSWQAAPRPMPEPEPVNLFGSIREPQEAEGLRLRLLPKAKEPFLLHAQLVPMPVADGDNAYFPVALFCIGDDSGLIHGLELLRLDAWQEEAVPTVLRILETVRTIPKSFVVADDRLLPLAEACARLLGVKAKHDPASGELLSDVFESLGSDLGF